MGKQPAADSRLLLRRVVSLADGPAAWVSRPRRQWSIFPVRIRLAKAHEAGHLRGGGITILLLVTVGVSRLKPAAPSVDRATVWVDTVKRGPMLRQVRGTGTLVPEDIRWIPAVTDGRVERIILRPGAVVTPDTVILELEQPRAEPERVRGRTAAARRRGPAPEPPGGAREPVAHPARPARHRRSRVPPGAAAGRGRRDPGEGRPHERADDEDLAVARRGTRQPHDNRAPAPRDVREGTTVAARRAAGRGRPAARRSSTCGGRSSTRSKCARALPACCSRCPSRWAPG
jgi:hypothetical protein